MSDSSSEPRDRISVTFYSDAGELGGAELSLGNLLASLSPRVDATVVGTSAAVVERLASCRMGAKAMVLRPIAGMRDVRSLWEHLRAFRRARPDILHVNRNTSAGSPWPVVAGLAVPGSRVIAVEHLPYPIRRARRRWLTRLTSRRLAAHVAVGDRAAKDAARFIGLANGSIRSIPNGVPDLELEPLPRPSAGPVVGSLGRLHDQKAYDVLVRALPQLPDVTAVIVGEGDARGSLIEVAGDLGVADRLLLPGWSGEPRRHLTTFDIFVLPSRREGLPLVVIEAMLAGLPVVASDVGSISEAVVDGTTGLLVPSGDSDALADAIAALLADPERRSEMGRRGRERALERFTVDAMAAQYEALYIEVLS